jgi:hypothetical protein
MLISVVELPEFVRQAKALMSEAERTALINLLAANPTAGVALGGGLYKLRVAREGGGKSSGFRSVHYYQPDRGLPVFLMVLFAKNAKSNMTPAEEASLRAIGERIAETYGGKR